MKIFLTDYTPGRYNSIDEDKIPTEKQGKHDLNKLAKDLSDEQYAQIIKKYRYVYIVYRQVKYISNEAERINILKMRKAKRLNTSNYVNKKDEPLPIPENIFHGIPDDIPLAKSYASVAAPPVSRAASLVDERKLARLATAHNPELYGAAAKAGLKKQIYNAAIINSINSISKNTSQTVQTIETDINMMKKSINKKITEKHASIIIEATFSQIGNRIDIIKRNIKLIQQQQQRKSLKENLFFINKLLNTITIESSKIKDLEFNNKIKNMYLSIKERIDKITEKIDNYVNSLKGGKHKRSTFRNKIRKNKTQKRKKHMK